MNARARRKITAANETVPNAESGSLLASDGSTASIEDGCVVLRNSQGQLLVSYDPEARSATICAPAGDLNLCAPRGKVVLSSRDGIQGETKGDIQFKSRTLTAFANDMRLHAQELQLHAGRCETAATRIIQRTCDLYQEVENLAQTRAGRLRAIVQGATQLFAKSTSIVSEEDTSVDGRRVLMG